MYVKLEDKLEGWFLSSTLLVQDLLVMVPLEEKPSDLNH